MSTGFNAGSSEIALPYPLNFLHKRSQKFYGTRRISGFSLIEILIVILVLGILCATGISIYAGVTEDTQTRTRKDELNSFFSACRHRAMLRKTPVNIRFNNNMLTIDQSNTLRLRLPDLAIDNNNNVLNELEITTEGKFLQAGKIIKNLSLPFRISGNRLITITVEL